jgi:excinuclease ABC subunit C
MAQCLRPCQAAVSPAEYASEVDRLVSFLSTEGRSLADTVEHMRDRFSADMEFEEAARQHRRLDKIHALWRQRDDLAALDQCHYGIAVTKSLDPNAVTLFFLLDGVWHPPVPFPLQPADGRPVSLDRRLRETVDALTPSTQAARLEHLALLARWYYSSWCDGEWLGFPSLHAIPYRKVVNMIHRVSGV